MIAGERDDRRLDPDGAGAAVEYRIHGIAQIVGDMLRGRRRDTAEAVRRGRGDATAERSQQRGRVAMVLLDNLGIHTPKGSRLLRALLDELRDKLVLVYTPTYDPESNRIEWLWRSLRRAVTHTHQHATLPPLLEASDTWAHKLTPRQILRQIGSPCADTVHPRHRQALAQAA